MKDSSIGSPTERFSDRVENYVRYRPSYPEPSIDWLVTSAGLAKNMILEDIGSGTGIFTELLLKRDFIVYGIEPNREMRQAAENLLAHYPNLEVLTEQVRKQGWKIDQLTSLVLPRHFIGWSQWLLPGNLTAS